MGKKMKDKWKRIMVWCMVMVLMCANCTFQSEAKTSSKVKVSKTAITSVKSKTAGQATVTFKKQKKASGYQVQISTDKKFKKSVKTLKVSAKKKTATFKKLKQGRKYYARVRVYRTVKKKRYYSSWSKVKSVVIRKTKKTQESNKTSIKTYNIELDTTETPYDGEPCCPHVRVWKMTNRYNDFTGYRHYLKENYDYKVSYKNNISFGTATATITGIGDYTGTVIKKYKIVKGRWNGTVTLKNEDLQVGDKVAVTYSKQPETKGEIREYEEDWQRKATYTEKCLGKDKNGNVICKKTGYTRLCIVFPESEHYTETFKSLGKVKICNNTDPLGGFFISSYTSGTTTKSFSTKTIIKKNGKGTIATSYESEADAAWVKKHMTFKAVDATPPAYKKAVIAAGWNVSAPTVKVTTSDLGDGYYESIPLTTPVTSGEVMYSDSRSMSKSRIEVTLGEGVRVCRVDAYKDGVLYDSIYIATQPYDEDGNYLDDDLYTKTRRQIEAKLWTDDMTNYQKLCVLANYINSTAHYPGSGSTQKETNPTFWKNFSVDGIDLYYRMFNMPRLNRVMALRGGTITCFAVEVVSAAAVEDLGLPYLYNKADNTIADGEGVYLARGSASSNPYAAMHESVIYIDANNNGYFIDAQGMMRDDSCEEHGCLNRVIRD